MCYLLRIKSPVQIPSYPLIGSRFENWVISEIKKSFHHNGNEAPLYFWRDQHGHEVDLVIDEGNFLFCMEIKSGKTLQKTFLNAIIWLNKLQDRQTGACIYGGDRNFQVNDIAVRSWENINGLVSPKTEQQKDVWFLAFLFTREKR